MVTGSAVDEFITNDQARGTFDHRRHANRSCWTRLSSCWTTSVLLACFSRIQNHANRKDQQATGISRAIDYNDRWGLPRSASIRFLRLAVSVPSSGNSIGNRKSWVEEGGSRNWAKGMLDWCWDLGWPGRCSATPDGVQRTGSHRAEFCTSGSRRWCLNCGAVSEAGDPPRPLYCCPSASWWTTRSVVPCLRFHAVSFSLT